MKEVVNTPCFVIHKEILDDLVLELTEAVREYWPRAIVGYSVKTNNLPWILEYMKNKGIYAEVVSSDEYNMAKKIGYNSNRIIFNGPVKGEKEFKEAVKKEAIINIDSKRELRWLTECKDIKAQIGLRVNFDLESMCPGESQCGVEDSRFGFSYEAGEFSDALEYITQNKITLKGLHLHCSSKTRSLDIYLAIAEIAVKLVREFNLDLEYIDIGGGFFGGVIGKPTFKDYFSAVKHIFNEEPRLQKTNLIVEPGMAVIGASIEYISKIIDVKKTKNNNFVTIDGSRIHIDPLMRKSGYVYDVNIGDNRNVVEKQTICGFTCMENDRLFVLNDSPAFKEGDSIVFKKVGAYTMGLSPLFIQLFPRVYVNDGNIIKLVRQKWTEEKFINY